MTRTVGNCWYVREVLTVSLAATFCRAPRCVASIVGEYLGSLRPCADKQKCRITVAGRTRTSSLRVGVGIRRDEKTSTLQMRPERSGGELVARITFRHGGVIARATARKKLDRRPGVTAADFDPARAGCWLHADLFADGGSAGDLPPA